ncbi:MAG: DUF397 domain-containing protein [Kutzneria sp.]|nr:DUF397 domain-containing protein [Kutzneria sp.]
MTCDDTLAVLTTAPGWRKATTSNQNGCVEINQTVPGYVGVRDSKLATHSPILVFTAAEFALFRTAVRAGTVGR